MITQTNEKSGGYTLLFAVLTAALVLGVAVFIVDLSRKQNELAVSARNSIYSFYAADSGIECAVNQANWRSGLGFSSTTPGAFSCGAAGASSYSVSVPSISPTSIISAPILQQQVNIPLTFSNGTVTESKCAHIIITTGRSPSNSQPMTIIDSRGYNKCNEYFDPDTVNKSTVERALRVIQTGVW